MALERGGKEIGAGRLPRAVSAATATTPYAHSFPHPCLMFSLSLFCFLAAVCGPEAAADAAHRAGSEGDRARVRAYREPIPRVARRPPPPLAAAGPAPGVGGLPSLLYRPSWLPPLTPVFRAVGLRAKQNAGHQRGHSVHTGGMLATTRTARMLLRARVRFSAGQRSRCSSRAPAASAGVDTGTRSRAPPTMLLVGSSPHRCTVRTCGMYSGPRTRTPRSALEPHLVGSLARHST